MQFAKNGVSSEIPCVMLNGKPQILHNKGNDTIVLYDDGTAQITQFPLSLQIQINMSLLKIDSLNTKNGKVSLFEDASLAKNHSISKCVNIFLSSYEGSYDKAIIGKISFGLNIIK
jgi:hypothetical protein